MVFDPERVGDFKENFDRNKNSIRQFPGCEKLQLLQESGKENVFFTYSWWQRPEDLEEYRNSDLFKGVWSYTRSLFAEKPQAWSVTKLEDL